MRAFTTVALDRLLEPGGARSTDQNPLSRPPLKLQPSPALYTTPKTTSLPDSPTSFSPSPYIINHKRRGPRLLKSLSQPDIARPSLPPPDDAREVEIDNVRRGADGKDIRDGGLGSGDVGDGEVSKVDIENDGDGDGDDFLDPLDTASNASSGSFGRELTWKPGTPLGEFYDALEDISSEGTPISCRNIEDELREMRLNVLMEIERRKKAEAALENSQSQWQRSSHHLSQVGLLLPVPPTITEEMGKQSDVDPAEVLCQQVIVARSVAAAIGRGCSRAEVELELEPQIEAKNFEIARLWDRTDRLHYYEAANREMSQRNQEAVEMARQQRHRRKRRQKWLWGTIGLTITLGTAALARSYFRDSSHLQRKEGDSPVGDVS